MSKTYETGPEGQDHHEGSAQDLEQLRDELADLLRRGLVEWGDVGRIWRPAVDRRREPRRAG